MSIKENFEKIKKTLPGGVKLVAVSKTKPDEDIMEAYRTGHRCFGENRVQDLAGKAERLPADIEWHFIGHLQRNKVKYIVPFVHMIESVDSARLLRQIDKEAAKEGRRVDCLLQMHIAQEQHKFGFSMDELREEVLAGYLNAQGQNIRLRGLMGMATLTEDKDQIRREFQALSNYYRQLKEKEFADDTDFNQLSMGMSGDYPIAIEEGATMVRIGSLLFGPRQKH